MAKINVSVSSSSSKPNVTVSKGPVGPQGEQGAQGEAGPQGPAGVVSNLESITNVQIPSLESGGYVADPIDGAFIQNMLTFDPQNNRWTTFNAATGDIPTSGSKSASPPTGNSWTDPILTVDFNESTSVASTKLALNNSNYIPSDVNLYVNGTSRFNGSVQIASGGSTVYTLPSADGTANQILKTDGSGAVSFTGDYLTKSTADVITATKRFNVQQDFVGGVNITNGASINGYTLPTSDGTAGQFLKTDGSGNISFAAASSLALGTTSTTALAGDTTTISTTQASEIAANTLKVGITTQQASEIVANTAKTDTNVANTSLTLDDNRTLDLNGNDLTIDPKGGEFQINDSSGLPNTAEIAIAQGNVDIAGTQVSINGIDYPAVDGSAGQFLKTDGSGNLSFSNVAQSIDGLTDVDTTTAYPSNGQALVWDNAAGQWEPGTVGIDGISSSYTDTEDPRNWLARSEQIIGVGSFNTSGVEIASGESSPRDLFFKPDGTRMFFVGNSRDDIQSVDLPTAWDLSSIASTATVTSVDLLGSSSIGGEGHEGTLYNMHVANDPSDTATYGKKFFISGDQRDEVQEYTCTTAWDLSTMSATPTAYLDIGSTSHGNSVYSITFNPDGSIMYIGRGGNPNTFSHFDLSTSWDLSTAVYNSSKSATLSVTEASYGNSENYIIGMAFNENGTKAYVSGRTQHDLHTLTLSTAYDLSTYTDDQIPVHLDSSYIEQAFGALAPAWSDQGFQWPSGLFSTSDYFYVLFNTSDQIIRLDKKYYELNLESRVSNKAVFQAGLRSYGTVEVIGNLQSSNFSTGGNAYFSGAMNWAGFNSGPAVTKDNSFILGTSMRSLGFVNSGQPSGYGGPTTHDINNTKAGTWIFASDLSGANNIVLPELSGNVLLDTTSGLYFNKFNTESASKVTGATEDIEYYYTARSDGQGLHKRILGALPATGQTLTRTSYYSNKALADPDTASDWTQGTAYSSTSLDSAISQSNDALLNVQSTGTPPLSTKIVISGYLGSSGLLIGDSNGFGGTSVAYSLRLVNNAYSGAAIRVVNDSGVEADIGFGSNLELDTTALLTHCGSGDGYLVKWYDQAKGGSTGDGNDATWESSTSYSSRKPQIVSSGVVITDNGKPCIETIDAGMIMESEFSASGEFDFFAVCQKTINNGNHGMIFGTQQGNDNRIWFRDYQMNLELNNGETNNFRYFNDDGSDTLRWYQMGQMVFNVRRDSSDVNTAQRNSIASTFSYTRNGDFRGDRILNAWNNKQYSFGGNVQEIIIFDGDKSSERSAIQSNLNTYYSVY